MMRSRAEKPVDMGRVKWDAGHRVGLRTLFHCDNRISVVGDRKGINEH